MIKRFYNPLFGRILFVGSPIGEFNGQEHRKHIALISQEPVSTMCQYIYHDDQSLLDFVFWHDSFQHHLSLLGVTKPESEEVTQEEIEAVCHMQIFWILSSRYLSKSTHIH